MFLVGSGYFVSSVFAGCFLHVVVLHAVLVVGLGFLGSLPGLSGKLYYFTVGAIIVLSFFIGVDYYLVSSVSVSAGLVVCLGVFLAVCFEVLEFCVLFI